MLRDVAAKQETVLTMAEIEAHWEKYSSAKVMRVLKAGKWEIMPLDGKGIPRINAVRANVVPLKSVMSFPKYLRKHAN